MLPHTNLLFDEHWEIINCCDLDSLYEQFFGEDYAEEGWNAKDVQKGLRNLLDKCEEELRQSPDRRNILDEWYKLVEWINDLLPNGDRFNVQIEDDLPKFLSELLRYESELFVPIDKSQISNEEAQWLGKVAVLASYEDWRWKGKETFQLFNQLVSDFNDRHNSF